MTTDFNYNNKTIDSNGPIKPSGIDQPGDPRTRVKSYSDIKLIPNPYLGMIITVEMDETNQNKMTDYKVVSLKANTLGIANTVIDRVQRYVEYLGVSFSGGGTGTGLTTEQTQQLQTAYEHSQSVHVQASDIPSLNGYATETFVTSKIAEAQLGGGEVDLSDYATKTYADNAVSTALDGHTFKFLTQSEYDALPTKDPLVEYHITDAIDSNKGLTTEQAQNIAQVPTLKSYVDAITIIKDNGKAIKSYEPLATNTLAETEYTNNFNFQANAININGNCYMVFMYDLTSILNTSPNEVFKIKFNIPKFGVIRKTGFGCNLANSYPPDPNGVNYGEIFNIENEVRTIPNWF